jgi:hypothetical protein
MDDGRSRILIPGVQITFITEFLMSATKKLVAIAMLSVFTMVGALFLTAVSPSNAEAAGLSKCPHTTCEFDGSCLFTGARSQCIDFGGTCEEVTCS